MSVYRVFVTKKEGFNVEETILCSNLKTELSIDALEGVKIYNRYDAEGLDNDSFEKAKNIVFSEPQVDDIFDEMPENAGAKVFAVEFLPGQFDQRADSCAQCIQLLTQKERPLVRSAKVYVISGNITDEQLIKIKSYLVNPVESRLASLDLPKTLADKYTLPEEVETLYGFIDYSVAELSGFVKKMGLAMDLDDIKFCQAYFRDTEKRDPTITEIRMIDTYWSDHCRHTTFLTHITSSNITPDYVTKSYEKYKAARQEYYPDSYENRPVTLMDIATMGAKILRRRGQVPALDISDEINACSVEVDVDVNGQNEPWLFMFKNETHNHPTEIEPFGGAATCLGGAIRDPLSGRSYVYQAMRVTGAADPTIPLNETLPNKLPQKKITTGAASGYSSYGNQIGLATGHVSEIYHPGYVAKRMEIGAVVGAAPMSNVRRSVPQPGDLVVLLGGRTGRDGCGGATGSSKSHTSASLESCGAEVQKGNPPEERKIQRLFRNPEVTHMIKRCNDFGAGGVSVAIGELADGLVIDLDKVPKKYDGLDGTELAISESQERMAVVIANSDKEKFIEAADKENLEATCVASVCTDPRLIMYWKGKEIVNLSREFLNSNGAVKETIVSVDAPDTKNLTYADKLEGETVKEKLLNRISELNVCSQKGLVERFDSTIGASTVLMPFGGKNQLTPAQAMAAKMPVLNGETTTASLMAWGFNPYISSSSPYHGAAMAVIESVARLVAAGGSLDKCWLTFQEYFERTQDTASRWGKPFSALLGAFEAQVSLGLASIGGKDSMSGTFENIDVPPTLVSFAAGIGSTENIISPEFKKAGSKLYLVVPEYDENALPVYSSVLDVFANITSLIKDKKVISAWALGYGGIAEGIVKMAIGNDIGADLTNLPEDLIFEGKAGAFILEAEDEINIGTLIGETVADETITLCGETISLNEIKSAWTSTLENVFPTIAKNVGTDSVEKISFNGRNTASPAIKVAKPKVFIPVFPGTNCEYDTARAFEKAGAKAEILVIRNLTSKAVEESVEAVEKAIKSSQIIMLPGGFSGGDEPDGSGKFIAAFFRNAKIKDAVHDLLKNRDGLMLGICNGFQALIKLGLVPYGEIVDMDENCPTLTFNAIGRHQSKLIRTRIASNKSPWFAGVNVDDIHTVAISHGEGRFVANDDVLSELIKNGQVATQYVDLNGVPTMDIDYNPNASMLAIEGITSPDGRVLGKMAHSERFTNGTYKNVEGNFDQKIFESGVKYFK